MVLSVKEHSLFNPYRHFGGTGIRNIDYLAAKNGHLNVLQWCRESVPTRMIGDALLLATRYFNIIQYARENGCRHMGFLNII